MSKKKSNNKSQIVSFDQDNKFDMLASLMREAHMHDLEDFPGDQELAVQLTTSTINSTINLSKLVIDNRNHKSQKMNDEDIYKIFRKSFETIIKLAPEGSVH